MDICDRCRKNKPKYICNVSSFPQVVLCEKCSRELDEMRDIFDDIEKEFMLNKTLKHIDVNWS